MAQRLVSVDANYMFPTPLEARLGKKMAAAVNESPKIAELAEIRREISLLEPSTATDSRTAVNVRIPFRSPFTTSRFRVHLRNRNPSTGIVTPGALSFTGVGVGTAQVSGTAIFSGLTEASASLIQGAFSTPPDGAEHVTGWKTDFPLSPGVVYHLSYGYNGPAQANYAGAGTAFTNNSPTGALSRNMTSPLSVTTAPLDVWIEAVTDNGSTRQVLYAGIMAPAAATTPGASTSSRTSITTFGDSLTHGGSNGAIWPSEDSWPSKLDTALSSATVTNYGYSGATVDELLIRIGARRLKFTVAGGVIPAQGNTTVTTTTVIGVPASRTWRITGKLAGVPGELQRLSGGAMTFNTYGVPAATVSGKAEFVPEWDGRTSDTSIIWIGINDVTYSTTGLESSVADHVVAGTQELVAWLTPQIKQFLILGVTTRLTETSGTAAHATVQEINTRLNSLYPGHFRSVQDYLRTSALTDMGLTPTEADMEKIAAGTVPPSALAAGDQGHVSKEAAAVIATKLVAPYLLARGWVDA